MRKERINHKKKGVHLFLRFSDLTSLIYMFYSKFPYKDFFDVKRDRVRNGYKCQTFVLVDVTCPSFGSNFVLY